MNGYLISLRKKSIEKLFYKPKLYPWAEEARDTQFKNAWVARKIDYNKDNKHLVRFNKEDTDTLLRVLTPFTQSDINVAHAQVLVLNALCQGNSELIGMFSSFTAIESVHIEAYSAFVDVLLDDEAFREAYKNIPSFNTWTEEVATLYDTFIECDSPVKLYSFLFKNFLIPEGVVLFTLFALLDSYDSRKLGSLDEIVRYSMRDECLHVVSMKRLLNVLGLDKHYKECFKELREHMNFLIDDILNYIYNPTGKEDTVSINGITRKDLEQYARYNFNNLLPDTPVDVDDVDDVDVNPFPELETKAKNTEYDTFSKAQTQYINA